MKRLLPIILSCVMMLLLITTPVSANKGKSFTAEYGKPTLDGKIDNLWSSCESTVVNLPHDGKDKGSSDKATVKALWDETGIYFLVEAKDSNYVEEKEIFEFYIDEAFDKSEKYNKNDRQTRFYVKTGIDPVTKEWLTSSQIDDEGKSISHNDLIIGNGSSKTADGWILEVTV